MLAPLLRAYGSIDILEHDLWRLHHVAGRIPIPGTPMTTAIGAKEPGILPVGYGIPLPI
jgi:hypothetical protein